MRPAHTLLQTLFAHTVSADLALIGWGHFQYNRQETPVMNGRNGSALHPLLTEGHSTTGEAAMKSQRPQSDETDDSEIIPTTSSHQPPANESREQRLARIRAEIQAGVYETEEKLDAAIDRMLGVISRD